MLTGENEAINTVLTGNKRHKRPAQATQAPTVAVVGPVAPPTNGISVLVERIFRSQELASQFRVIHIDTSDHRELTNIGHWDFRNVYLAILHWLRTVVTLARCRPDVVQVPLAQNFVGLLRDWTLLIAANCSPGTNVVGYIAGGGLARFLVEASPVFRRLLLNALHRCAVLVVSSEWHYREVQQLFGDSKLMVVWQGTEEVENGQRELSRGTIKALYVSSSFTEDKGFFDTLEAAALTEKHGVPVRWEFIGTFRSWRDEQRATARASEIDSAAIVGPLERDAVLKAYREADLFVFPPSPKEGFGLVRVEAMAAGLPVITTEAGGGREVVVDGEHGFIVRYGQPQEIAARVIELAQDPDRLLKMGNKALDRQRSEFSLGAFDRSLAAAWHTAATNAARISQ